MVTIKTKQLIVIIIVVVVVVAEVVMVMESLLIIIRLRVRGGYQYLKRIRIERTEIIKIIRIRIRIGS